MYIFLSQLFTPLLSPLGISTALWVAALWFLLRRRRGRAGSCAAAGILFLLLFSTPMVAGRLLGSLENDFELLEPEAHPEADVIVVLVDSRIRRSHRGSPSTRKRDSTACCTACGCCEPARRR